MALEERRAKILINKAGGSAGPEAKSYRVALPSAWMKALGIRFLDAAGKEVGGCGEDLIRICDIDTSGLDPRVSECRFTVMCDVSNPLCGKNGATHTFGRQKGGTSEIIDELEGGMQNYRDIIREKYGMDMDVIPGAGAAASRSP